MVTDTNIITILSKSVSDKVHLEYLGCYSNAPPAIGGQQENRIPNNSPDNCAKTCQSKGSKFFGLGEHTAGGIPGTACMCAQTYDSSQDTQENSLGVMCGHKCPGDNSKWCGGAMMLSVYRITSSRGKRQIAK